MKFIKNAITALLASALILMASRAPAADRCEFNRSFAPSEGFVAAVEQPYRQAVCLNGLWQFQPVSVPADFVPGRGDPPKLPPARANGWEATPIKIPSPWNVNTWGCGRDVGEGSPHPYWPSSVYYPSYPTSWDSARMGWLRRSFRVPTAWSGCRIVLHFEAVAGQCEVYVNGTKASEHFDKYLPFDLDITDWVRRGKENELLVGVREHRLFQKQSEKYGKMILPYPCGSNTESLAGIWQDVVLLGLPAVRVDDVFVQSHLDRDMLDLDVALRNDTTVQQKVILDGQVAPWVNLAGKSVLDAPEPAWRLDPPVMTIGAKEVVLPPGATTHVRLTEKVSGRLKTWSPATPNLYCIVARLTGDGAQIDSRYTRFGWRQWKLQSRDLLLNGEKIQLFGDLVHPFGPYAMSRRFVWAWYTMVKDFGGNAIRPHAQIHPRIYLDLADEMGILVLDETALFGSSIQLNFDDPEAWRRFEAHYDGLVLRDRNHPSVFGWSFGNELFAIFNLNRTTKEDEDRWYGQLAKLGLRAKALDPTRGWISCDGDEDLRGALPVWSKHFGHGTPLDRLPEIDKPMMVGESGGTYYAKPKDLAIFNGARAFASYAGRNEALAIDLYDNLVRMARPKLTYFSASETVWFGLEHLNLGYADYSRLPGPADGVFLIRPYEDGQAGMQPERIPPYVTTLNPGLDAALPLYKPLAMFDAQKAALQPGGPQPSPYSRRMDIPSPQRKPAEASVDKVGFVGDRSAALARRLADLGVVLADDDAAKSPLTIIDGDTLSTGRLPLLKQRLDALKTSGGAVLWLVGRSGDSDKAVRDAIGADLQFKKRQATALVADDTHPWVASLTLPRLYFAEENADRQILKQGMEGPWVDQGQVLLSASNTDWSLFNDVGENGKCAAVVLDQQIAKPAPAALVVSNLGRGSFALCTIDWRLNSPTADALWRTLFANMGVRLGSKRQGALPAFDDQQRLVNALCLGRFSAKSADAALAEEFLDPRKVAPRAEQRIGGRVWRSVASPSKDRFLLRETDGQGPTENCAVYFSFYLHSPRALDDVFVAGPDAPKLTALFFTATQSRVYLNGALLKPARSEDADYRTLDIFDGLPLKKGWNHFLVKVAAETIDGDKPGTLAVRLLCDKPEYLEQIDSAVELGDKTPD